MSSSKGDLQGGFTPPKLKPPSFTFSQFQEIAEFFKRFLDDSPLRKWIMLAGIGGLVELIHTAWLALRFIAKF